MSISQIGADRMKWIIADDIVNWVERAPKDAQQQLPRFVRLLIQSQVDAKATVEMPEGEGTAAHGWDGLVSFDGNSRFVPNGRSLWEIGTDRKVKTKADKDFDGRSANPVGENPKNSTFVFVSPRKWEEKNSWITDKKRHSDWQDIVAFNARDLEDWFEAAPAVAREFALHIRKFVGDIRSLDEFWREWSAATEPAITSEMVLAGREDQASELKRIFEETGSVITVHGETVDEAIAFIYAAISEFGEPDAGRALSRSIVCESEDSIRSSALVPEHLVTIIPARLGALVGSLRDAGNSVVVVDFIRAGNEDNGLTLEVPWRSEFQIALCEAGLAEEVALQVATQTGASISAYRRLQPVGRVPISGTWDASLFADVMIPAMLAGQWEQRKDASDWEILERLALKPERVAESELRKLLELEAAPLRREGELWVLASPSDAFLAVGRYISAEHLDAFREAAHEVLSELDPRFELEPSKRDAASIHGKNRQYSGRLRRGIAQALCLISIRLSSVGGGDGEAISEVLVRQVLENVGEEGWIGWASSSDILPWLAEAAPTQFLAAVERTLRDHPETFSQLMTDEDGFSGMGACLHSGLLWALEALAWFHEHLPRAALALAGLAAVDPGGQWGNRPLGSLIDIFLTWKNHSAASVARRLAVIDRICENHREIGWELLKGLTNTRSTSGTHQPKWRAVTPLTLTVDDRREYFTGLRKRYLEIGLSDPVFLADVIDGEQSLPPDDYVSSVERIHQLDLESQDATVSERLRRAVRHRLYRIRSYSKPKDINAKMVSALEAAYERLSNLEPVDRHLWLFERGWPELPSGGRQNHEEYHATVQAQRREAIKDILEANGLLAAIELAGNAALDGRFAAVLGLLVEGQDAERVIDQLGEQVTEEYPVSLADFAHGALSSQGEDWIKQQVGRVVGSSNRSRVGAALMLALPKTRLVWDYVSSLGPDTERQYWRWVSIWSPAEDSEFAISKLMEVGRVFDALDVCANGKEDVQTSTIADVLRNAIEELSKPKEPTVHDILDYHIEELFECLDGRTDIEIAEVASLEFPFARVFRHNKRGMRATDQLIQDNPGYFAKLVSWAYKRDDSNEGDDLPEGLTDEEINIRAENSYVLLGALRFVPGQHGEKFEPTEFIDWIRQCSQHLSELGRQDNGARALAIVVQGTPVGDDGIWPVRNIRATIESLCSDRFCDALHSAFFNARGATTRSLDEGGKQERELVEKYLGWADAIDIEAPRIAAVFRLLAKTYEHYAWGEDTEARARRLGD